MTEDGDDAELVAAARAVRRYAHAPWSGFAVGAALRTAERTVHLGVNVESVALPAGLCAERAALAAAVTAGHRHLATIAVAGPGDAVCAPCGVCRQALAEFGLQLTVIGAGEEGPTRRWRLGELLPDPFTPAPEG